LTEQILRPYWLGSLPILAAGHRHRVGGPLPCSFSPQALASWTSLLGAVATLLGLIQSRGWLTAVRRHLHLRRRSRLSSNARQLRLSGSARRRLKIEGISIERGQPPLILRRRINRTAYSFKSVEQKRDYRRFGSRHELAIRPAIVAPDVRRPWNSASIQATARPFRAASIVSLTISRSRS